PTGAAPRIVFPWAGRPRPADDSGRGLAVSTRREGARPGLSKARGWDRTGPGCEPRDGFPRRSAPLYVASNDETAYVLRMHPAGAARAGMDLARPLCPPAR